MIFFQAGGFVRGEGELLAWNRDRRIDRSFAKQESIHG
jgi:hypothetical protein